MDNCIFCKIANGSAAAHMIRDSGAFVAILDRFPWTDGHALIIIKRHAETIFELTGAECAELSQIIFTMSKKINETLKPDGLNVMQNNGAVAGQSVGHFHVHLIPRYTGDGVGFTFPNNDPDDNYFHNILSTLKGEA